jgi:hypothetical protein
VAARARRDDHARSRPRSKPALSPTIRHDASCGLAQRIFKSLDLIPDGIEDLGFIDDAFVFRVAAAPPSVRTRRARQGRNRFARTPRLRMPS